MLMNLLLLKALKHWILLNCTYFESERQFLNWFLAEHQRYTLYHTWPHANGTKILCCFFASPTSIKNTIGTRPYGCWYYWFVILIIIQIQYKLFQITISTSTASASMIRDLWQSLPKSITPPPKRSAITPSPHLMQNPTRQGRLLIDCNSKNEET